MQGFPVFPYPTNALKLTTKSEICEGNEDKMTITKHNGMKIKTESITQGRSGNYSMMRSRHWHIKKGT